MYLLPFPFQHFGRMANCMTQSHSLWYSSSRNPITPHAGGQQNNNNNNNGNENNSNPGTNQRRNTQAIERSPLARLRADEQIVERRLHNVSNFGSTWLKPPGIPKTLHQLREERREQEEHQEAMRREQLAQELAEAEAAGTGGAEAMLDAPGEDGMDDVQLDGARDLDDDIPDADADFGLNSIATDTDDEAEVDEEDQAEEDLEQRVARTQQELMAQRMRQADDPFRENAPGHSLAQLDDDDVGSEAEYQSQMIEEGDISGGIDGGDMDMEADLDDDIPEAESAGGYEHTDTEADLSSSDDDDPAEMSFAAGRAPQAARFRGSMAHSDATRNSMAISDILSGGGSSLLGSSPQIPRLSQGGPSRQGPGRA